MTRLTAWTLAALIGAAMAFPAAAQTSEGGTAPSGILVLNQDRMLSQTLLGQRLERELEAATAALAAENRRIEGQLTEEELDLTELRETLPPDEFRVLADEFDVRVDGIRAAQDAKTRDLQAQVDAAQQLFFEAAFPILLEIVQARGAAVLMDSRSVLLSAGSVDITEAAIARIDEVLGEGGEAPLVDVQGLTIPESAP